MELKVMTWNIQGAAVLSWNKSYEIKKELVDKIFDQKADVAVLTELVISKGWDYFQERLEDNDYIWFMTNRTGKNGILIFIKKHLVDKKKLVHSLYQGNTILSNTDDCNILRVTLPVFQNKTLTLMGVRMETGTTEASKVSLKAQYDAERKALDQVLFPKIEPPNDMYIVCGDFNNARCLGDLTKRFNLEDYQGYDMLPLDETVKKTNSLKIKGEHYYAAKAKTGNRKEGKDCQGVSGRRGEHKHSSSRGRRGSGNASRLGHAV